MALEIINNFSVESFGSTETGKQGEVSASSDEPHEITVDGDVHRVKGSLATATVVALYASASDVPPTWKYLHLWTSVDMYLQVVTAAVNFTVKIRAKTPFTLSYGSVLAAADTTDIVGGSEPSVAAIAKLNLGNYSGGSGDYNLAIVD